MRRRPRPSRPAFTLIETMVVVVILGILAVSVVPAIAGVSDSRQAAAWREVERRFVVARTMAMATGRSFGVRVDPSPGTFALLEMPASGGAPTAAHDALGQTVAVWSLATAYPGTAVTSFVGGDGSSATGTVWFGYDGAPQRRTSAGALLGGFTQDASVTLTGGRTVTIRRTSGLIER